MPLIIDRVFDSNKHAIAARIYHPDPQKKRPVIIYFHGGGHVCGSLETHDALCRRIAIASECVVILVGYRLAPEYTYPTGLIDCMTAFKQRTMLLNGLQADCDRVFFVGDSAGGNLALTVCYQLKEKQDTAIKGLALIYPSVDFSMAHDSFQRNGEGFLLTKEKIRWYFEQYFAKGEDRMEASPLYFKQLGLFPPLYIAVAEYDPLHDEGIAFAKKAESLGVRVLLEEFKGMIHVFAQLEKIVPDQVLQLVTSIGCFIKNM